MKARVAGVVLAGGQSRRFGRDKAEAQLGGISLLDWSLSALAPHADLLLISGRPHPLHVSVADRPGAGYGPLGGLAGAMVEAAERGYSHILSLPCDTPHLPEGQLAALCTHQPDGAYAAACPVIGFWPTRLGGSLVIYLEQGGDKAVRSWAAHSRIPSLAGFEGVANINRTGDLARAAASERTKSKTRAE